MRIPSEVVIKARSLRMGNGVSVPAILFVCGACGRVLKPGEGSRTCPDCGSRDIETRVLSHTDTYLTHRRHGS